MTDETKRPPESDADTPSGESADASRAAGSHRRTDDKSPSPGYESTDAGSLPPPPDSSSDARPTPESQAALTGKAPSGSSTSGTTVPAASGQTPNAPPPNETQEEKIARLKRTVEEAKARKAAQGGDAPATLKAGKTTPPASAPSDAKTSETSGAQAADAPQPPGGASPAVGDPTKSPSQSDLEKAAKIAEAKARAAATKQAAGEKPAATTATPPGTTAPPAAAPGTPKAPVKKKEEGPKPVDAAEHPLVKRLAGRLDGAVVEASMFLNQLSVRIAPARIVEACDLLRRDEETPFNYLSDLTCVHFPENTDAPFEMVYNLYSISTGERVRLKVSVNETEGVESVTGVWPTANWMEREVYDLFGVPFKNHPDLRRLLLPADWEGHPLRKDYPLEFMENNWTTKHLPEFTEVQQEQLEQRRAYGLESFSSPYERRIREIFRAGKEVMPKEHK
ncbi:MAG TPA: NADH-quinone oxidoreductase subunit C [Pyrinomonadaceae bacterium]|jgi:NADH-quinone oxidoreductase subunit C